MTVAHRLFLQGVRLRRRCLRECPASSQSLLKFAVWKFDDSKAAMNGKVDGDEAADYPGSRTGVWNCVELPTGASVY